MTSLDAAEPLICITAIVTTFNSADVLEPCLHSLQWVDELIVVDSGSTDSTRQIAESFDARVLEHPYENPVAQKEWSIPQARGNWILWIDSDEHISPELQAEIVAVTASATEEVGFNIPRLNHVFGQPVRYGGYYPDYQLRLFQRDSWYFKPGVQIHEHIQLRGTCGTLNHPLVHLAHRTVDQTTATLLIRWTSFEAHQRYDQGIRFSARQMLGRVLAAFLYRYFRLQGFRDGIRGLFVAGYWAAYLFIVYLKLWEIDNLNNTRHEVKS